MEKVININERLEIKKRKKQMQRYRGKIEAIHKLVHCSSCHQKCAMCGHQIGHKNSPDHSQAANFGIKFCEDCQGEFEEFISESRGKKRSQIFWHNQEWRHMWSSWLKYRQAINGFLDSPEFKLLSKEFETQS